MAEKIVEANLLTGKYDESNPFVIIGKKKRIAKKRVPEFKNTVLSKSKRKELQKQVSKKEKKLSRNELWKELESFTTADSDLPIIERPLIKQRKSGKTIYRSDKKRLPCCKIWRKLSSSSESSIDTDQFSSSEDGPPCAESSGFEDEKNNVITDVGKSEIEFVKDVELNEDENPRTNHKMENCNLKLNYVLVNRAPEIQASRLALPIVGEEATIMEKISDNDVVIICGATGCGKTTQIPQFLYEAGYTNNEYKIGITEPRRVAAISMSERVSHELNLLSGEVGYHIRYEKTTSDRTKLKFMTDGILLQEIKQDFELSNYSVIILDEAHERSIYTDVLLGLLSLIVRLRRRKFNEMKDNANRLPLKLIIMSATLRVDDFSENRLLFPSPKDLVLPLNNDLNDLEEKSIRPGAPPVLRIESRQYPVTCHFSKLTPDDYLNAAFRKVASIHRDSPPGGILIFLTGQREVKTLCKWLSECFRPSATSSRSNNTPKLNKLSSSRSENLPDSSDPNELNVKKPRIEGTGDINEAPPIIHENVATSSFNLDNFSIIPADEETELGLRSDFSSSASLKLSRKEIKQRQSNSPLPTEDGDIEDSDTSEIDAEVLKAFEEEGESSHLDPIYALPLYSLLPPDQQRRVFKPPPEGHRLVVVATNVAETSLTIPNIRYVVDSGKVKSKIYDQASGASFFRVVWISQASAEQRAGRAGRIGPGHCYRLYSSRIFTEMDKFSSPDILTRPIDEVVLLLKSYLGTTPLSRFPLPTPPSATAVEASERRLVALGALEERKTSAEPTRLITRAGRWMARLPLPARFARMLMFADQHELMPYAVVLVAALSVPDYFLPDPEPDPEESDLGLLPDEALAKRGKRKSSKSASELIMEKRTAFLRQFVKTQEDLLLGDLAILIGSFCCFERYWAQLTGIIPTENAKIEKSFDISLSIVSNPEIVMRKIVQNCGINWKAYTEIRNLRRQLVDILNANVPDLHLVIDPGIAKPSPQQIELLRQLFLVGSPCHLATKFDVPSEGLPAKDRRRLRYAYKVPGVSGAVFIDPSSPLARDNCAFIAFAELHTSSKPYLRYVCAISPTWIPYLIPHSYRVEGLTLMELNQVDTEVTESKIEADTVEDGEANAVNMKTPESILPPAPRYDADRDLVVAYAKKMYFVGADLVGGNKVDTLEYFFELPAKFIPVPLNGSAAASSIGAYESLVWSVRWFARAFLDGNVLPELSDWFPKRLKVTTPTRMLTLSWGLVRKEVRSLVSELLSKKIASRKELLAYLTEHPQFLLRELTDWIQNDHQTLFQTKWPPTALCKL